MFDFDADHNYEDNPECAGITSVEQIQNVALRVFGRFLEHVSGQQLPKEVPEDARKFLSLNEIEAILRDHGSMVDEGFVLGGDTPEEFQQSMSDLMAALLKRILSNVLATGVNLGWLDVDFNGDTNDFEFGVTEEGKKVARGYGYTDSE